MVVIRPAEPIALLGPLPVRTEDNEGLYAGGTLKAAVGPVEVDPGQFRADNPDRCIIL